MCTIYNGEMHSVQEKSLKNNVESGRNMSNKPREILFDMGSQGLSAVFNLAVDYGVEQEFKGGADLFSGGDSEGRELAPLKGKLGQAYAIVVCGYT